LKERLQAFSCAFWNLWIYSAAATPTNNAQSAKTQGSAIRANFDFSAFFELLQWNHGYALRAALRELGYASRLIQQARQP
jgi:hypothetical protein